MSEIVLLSDHFSLSEMTRSETALRMGIRNEPPAAVIEVMKTVLAPGLEELRALVGPLHVNSGYRSEELERTLCAKDFYRWCEQYRKNAIRDWEEYFARKGHPKGLCADVVSTRYTPRQMIEIAVEKKLRFDQLIEEGTWLHAAFGGRWRGEVLTASFSNGVPSYSRGLA